jgi:hypothetical protein
MAELKVLEIKIARQTKEIENLNKIRENFTDAKTKQFKSAMKLERVGEGELSARSEYHLNNYLLIKHFLQPALEIEVKANADDLQIKVEITKELVDEIINKEVERREKNKEEGLRKKEKKDPHFH